MFDLIWKIRQAIGDSGRIMLYDLPEEISDINKDAMYLRRFCKIIKDYDGDLADALACADAEPVESDDIDLLEACYKELMDADPSGCIYAPYLFVCRKRKMLPLDRTLKNWNDNIVHFFIDDMDKE